MDVPSSSRRDPTTVRVLSVLCPVLLLISAGCSGGTLTGPSGQQGPVGLNVTNAANATHTFEVSVVELPANVTVRRRTGGDFTSDINPGLTTTDPGKYHITTSIELPHTARLHGRYTLKPGEMNISNISSPSENFAVVVVIYKHDHVASWVTSQCDGDLTYLGVTMRYYGSDSVYDCD